MKKFEAQLNVAVNALKEIALGQANSGVDYSAYQLRGIARDALFNLHKMQRSNTDERS